MQSEASAISSRRRVSPSGTACRTGSRACSKNCKISSKRSGTAWANRSRAQAAAAGNSRRTRSFARVQQSDIDRYQAARSAAQPAQTAPTRSAPAPAAQTAPNGAAAQPMTTA